MKKPTDKNGIALGILLLCPLLIIGYIKNTYFHDKTQQEALLHLQILYVGLLFVLSYYYAHKTILLRGLIWICEHLSAPGSRKMAFFYFGLCLFANIYFLIHLVFFRL